MKRQTAKDKTILIIEDEPAVLQALVDTFAREGFYVLRAKSGNKGLVLALKKRPDLILLDIIIPGMDGLAMLEKLRKSAWGKSIPVIILTNFSDDSKVSKALENGVYDFLVKTDWKIRDVVERAKNILGIGSHDKKEQ